MGRRARLLFAESSKSKIVKCSTLTVGLYSCFHVSTIRAGWSRIFSLSLFVENVMLGIDEVEKRLTPVVLEHTRQLGQVSLDLLENLVSNSQSPVIFMCCVCLPCEDIGKKLRFQNSSSV